MDVVLWGALIGAVAALTAAVLPKILDRIHARRREAAQRTVSVDRVKDPAAPDLFRALMLCERRIPEDERDEPEDIVRWLAEVRDETRRGVCKLKDFFLVARAGSDLAGFAYVQFYPTRSVAFFSYLVVDESVPEARYCHVSTALLRRVRELLTRHRQCRAILFEVDEPEILHGLEARRAKARIRHFKALSRMAGCPAKSVRIPYLQPKLAIGKSMDSEKRMRLMYAALNPTKEPDRLHKRDVAELVDFLSCCVYGDYFEHRADFDHSFRDYLRAWKARQLERIPEVVELT